MPSPQEQVTTHQELLHKLQPLILKTLAQKILQRLLTGVVLRLRFTRHMLEDNTSVMVLKPLSVLKQLHSVSAPFAVLQFKEHHNAHRRNRS